MNKFSAIATFFFLSLAGSSLAGGNSQIVSVGSDTQTRGYAGLAWTLGAKNSSLRPQLVLGAQSLKVRSDNHVPSGVDMNFRFAFSNGLQFDSARLAYVGGTRDVLGNVGVGYSSASKTFLTTLSAQTAYSRLGLDYDLASRTAIPFFDILTIDKPRKVNPIITILVC